MELLKVFVLFLAIVAVSFSEPECPLQCDSGYNCVYGPFDNSICAPTCAVTTCAVDQDCVMKQLRQCAVAPCPPDPVCVPKTDAVSVPECPLQCKSGYYCVPGFSISTAICAPTCAVKECPEDQKCIMKQLRQCFVAPCPPDPVCVPKTEVTETTPEAVCSMQCELGFQCVLTTEGPTCQATCEVIDCRDGMICIMDQVQCKREPCPPRPICVPTEKVSERECLLKCEAGYNCVYGPFSNSVCAPTCAVQKCAEDQKCVMKQLRQCLVEPCPPDPVCVPIAEEPECPLQCESGYYCVYGGPFNKSRCAPTCAVKECPEDQKCVMKQLRQCFAPPCPPDPVCVPKTEDSENPEGITN
ncbi:keratin-associated protein 4-3-like isoform X2 [Periplaneta americana]|uniref:keratin-associated protein 4-3-like isoform X2 n=1 Tax=Periplaneta americana TaxID=6978 RepID=UPI0037E74D41